MQTSGSSNQIRQVTWRDLVLAWCLWVPLAGVFATSAAAVEAAQKSAQQNDGQLTDEQWLDVMKSLDFTTLADRRYVQGMHSIVIDESAPASTRRMAAHTLGRVGEPAAVVIPDLIEIVQNPGENDLVTRLWALKALSLFGIVAEEATPTIAGIVLDETMPFQIRVNAMDALGRVGRQHQQTIPTLLRVLRSQPKSDSTSAKQLRMAVAEALWYLGPDAAVALPDLIQATRAPWSPLRLAAVTTIGEIGPQSEIAISILVDIVLFDEAGEVREAAADAMGNIGQASISALNQLIDDPDPEVQKLAIRAIRNLQSSPVLTTLLEQQFSSENPLTRVLAAEALLLNQPGHEKAIGVLAVELGNEERRVRVTAYSALLKNLGSLDKKRNLLIDHINSPETPAQSRSAAQRLLRKLEMMDANSSEESTF
ncbi:HEAT repeat domain-containing protein [Thalassoglobus neptunius]|uniref:HEAT repeat domain-containing protein n=1 Tax=Thalassoglobus neptunius TaxID=1938619 RepID=UPI0018D24A86|nr:HEAT repeat domain-containing protein [Thalassoglobus neptunius]